MPGIAPRDVTSDPSGVIDERLRRLLAIEKRDHDVPLGMPRVAAHGDHHVVSLAPRRRDVGVVEVRDEHEAVSRVDEPVPRAGCRDDDRAGTQGVDIAAVADEKAGADDGQRLLPGGRDDGERQRGLDKGVPDLGDDLVAAGE